MKKWDYKNKQWLTRPRYLNSLFLLFLFLVVVGFGFYGINKEYYTSSQIALFLEINRTLSGLEIFWLNVTALGDALLLFPLLSFLIFKNTQAWAAFFGAIPLSVVLSRAGKAFFSIPRPAAIIEPDQFTIIGEVLKGATSLPSGHTISIFAAVSAILYIFFYGDKKVKHLRVWSVGLIFLGSVVAISRVAVGAHWPFDLLLGAVFGFFGGLSGATLTLKYSTWWRWMTKPKFKYIHAATVLSLSIAMIFNYSQLIIAWLSLPVAGVVIVQLLAFKGRNELH